MKVKENKVFSWGNIALLLVIIIVAFGALGIYSKLLSSYLKAEALNRLTEVAQYNKFTIYKELNEKQTGLVQLSKFIKDEQDMRSQEVIERLKQICKDGYFNHIGIIYPDKEMYIVDKSGEKAINTEEIKYYFDKTDVEVPIGRIHKDSIDGKDSIVFSRYLYADNGLIRGVMFAAYDITVLQDLLSLKLFGGEGYSAIINEDGERIVAGTKALKMINNTNNVYVNLEYLNSKNKPVLDKVKEDLLADRSGFVRIMAYEPMYLYYQPLEINELSLLTVIPINVINYQYKILMRNTYVLSVILFVLAMLGIINFVSLEKKKQKRLENILYNDKVTGGFSYEKFRMEAEKLLKVSNDKRAFIAFDIDKFKLINDIFGYETGNIVLSDIWKVICKNVSEGIVTRTYADNFLIIVQFKERKELEVLTENIVKDIAQITTIKMEKFRIIPSMGIYVIERNDMPIEYMENRAMMAKRLVKDKYGNFYCFYYDEIKDSIIKKKHIMDGILQALARNEFYVYYQPKYDAKMQKIVGGEALIRWIRQEKIFISPVEFIPIAEEVGSIIDIDKYIFESVCRQQNRWKQDGFKILPVSVNVSRNRLYKTDFLEEYTEILHRYGLNTCDIEFEITEGSLVSDQRIGEQIVDKIRLAGFDVLIDDFGTGYSSLGMIRDINASEIKIDKSFVNDMSIRGKALIKNIIDIAAIVNMKTVAEGVETKEQYEFLRDNNCDIIQGYYFSKPISASEYETYMEKI